jgi:FkbM family methyltransferase
LGLPIRAYPRETQPALAGLDLKLSEYLDFDHGFFIEAGANDGFKQSNTFYLENARGWKGVLIEPIPELFLKCKELRKRSRCFNRALVREGGDETVTMHYADLMSVVDGALHGAEVQHVEKGMEVQGLPNSYNVEVRADTIDRLLEEAGAPNQIDFMSLDVEGYEGEALRGMSFSKYRPRFILVEVRFPDEVEPYLGERGYIKHATLSHHDVLFLDGTSL